MTQYSGINFLRERVRLQEATLVSDKRIAFITSIGLGLCMALLISISGYRLFIQRQKQKLADAIASEQASLRGMQQLQTLISNRSEKLKTVHTIFEKRGQKWDAITYFYRELPQDTSIASVNLSPIDESLRFQVTSPNVFAFTKLSETLQSQEVAQSGYKVTLGSLSRGRTGVYELTVKLAMQEQTKTVQKPKTVTQ